jgi:hypothetical protein
MMTLCIRENNLQPRFVNIQAIDYISGNPKGTTFSIHMRGGSVLQVQDSVDLLDTILDMWDEMLDAAYSGKDS